MFVSKKPRSLLFGCFIILYWGLLLEILPISTISTSASTHNNVLSYQNTLHPTVITATPQPLPSVTLTPPSGTSSSSTSIRQFIKANLDKVLIAALSVLGTLIAVYFQKILTKVGAGLEWVWKRFRVERALESRYRKNLARELRSVQILQMAEAKNLETIYIPLKLGAWMPPAIKESPENSNHKTLSMIEALEQFQRITIVGGPGSGKTTITSHATAIIADRSSKVAGKDYFPIYISLRRLKEFLESEKHKDKSLRDLLAEILDHHGFTDSRKFLDRRIEYGACLVVLDGFDELADETGLLQRQLSQKVTDFVGAIRDDDRIVLTSRASGYEPAWFGGFQVLEMTELTLPQINQFICGWFIKDQARGEALQAIIEQSERMQLLVATPLMLAILCFVYQNKNPEEHFLPTRRVDLYERCAKALIVDWDKSRKINRKPAFLPNEIDKILGHVAYDALVAEKIDFSRKALLTLIRPHLPKADRMRTEDEDCLKEIMEHTGLLREKASDTICFLHLTFYEYFAAEVIAEKVLQGVGRNDLRSELGDMLKNLANPRWFEPISLAAGILKGRSELVNLLYEEYNTRPTTELQLLLAGCLRDADLEKTDLDPEFLLIQDRILSEMVGMVSPME